MRGQVDVDLRSLSKPHRRKGRGVPVSFFSSLRVRLILLVLLAIVPALGIIFYDAAELREREVTKAKNEALTLSRLAARQHEELIEAARRALLSLAQLQEVRDTDSAACSARLTELLAEYQGYHNFAVADMTGNLFCSTPSLAEPVNVTGRMWFQRTIQTRDFTVSDYQPGWIDETPVIVFSYPVLDEANQPQAVVSASLEVAQLNQIAAETDLSNGTALMVIDRNGAIVVHYPQPEVWVGRTLPDAPLVMAIRATGEGKVEVAGLDGVTRLYAFTPLRSSVDTGLYLAIGIPKQVAFAEADRIWTRNLSVLGLVSLLALTAAWIGSDLFVLRQVNTLISATRRLRGDLSARAGLVHTAGELGQLARAFDDMAITLEQQEADRQRVREELIALNASLEQRVAQRTALMKLLQDIAVAANEAITVKAAMQFALDRVCTHTGWPIGHVYIPVGDGSDELISTYIWHLDEPERFKTFRHVTETAPFASGAGLPGRVFLTSKPAWIIDVTKDPNFSRAKLAKDIGVKAGFAFPVLMGKKVAAVLEFFSEETVEPDEALLEVMTHVGTQLGRVVERKQAEDALRQSEARFRAIFEGAAIGISLIDLEERIVESNPALQKMLGYTREELYRMSFIKFTHPADARASTTLYQELVSGKRDQYHLEKRYLRRDDRLIWGRLTASLVRDAQGDPSFVIAMVEDITEQKQMEAELAEVQRRLMESREAERLHLAQELHDGPLQDLHSMSFRLGELEAVLSTEASLGQMVATQATLQQVIQTLRSICGELRPPALAPFGLEKAIRSHAERFQKAYPELKIRLDLMPDGQTLPEQTRLTLFRIYQQALNNVNRHARASQVTIRLKLEPEQIILEIEDNGCGFKMPIRRVELARQGHLGLVGAVERAEAIGGYLKIISAPGEGTLIQAIVPHLKEQEMVQARVN
jgi:PAS domain S-box-containing protein